jgi:hypothetical protein
VLTVCHQLAISHDESSPDAADARTAIRGQNRLDGLQQQRIRKGFSEAGHGRIQQVQSGGIRSDVEPAMIPEPNEHVTDIGPGLFCWCRCRFRQVLPAGPAGQDFAARRELCAHETKFPAQKAGVRFHTVGRPGRLVISCGLSFTAQPKAPAITKAGASGWAVND